MLVTVRGAIDAVTTANFALQTSDLGQSRSLCKRQSEGCGLHPITRGSPSGERTVMDAATTRSWRVLLLGGASGTGKTGVSYRLAAHYGVGITEVDDFQVILECMTTPEQQPVLHYWRTHPEAGLLAAEEILELHLAVSRVMSPALEAVVANHVESNTPVVLEGDYILPEMAGRAMEAVGEGHVRTVFLYEADKEILLQNFSAREPEAGDQTKRARVSWLYGQWLKHEAEQRGLPALPARPWDTLLDGVLTVL
jgi:2-phosphoglycerate kinase